MQDALMPRRHMLTFISPSQLDFEDDDDAPMASAPAVSAPIAQAA
jgi:hypothetical protein